MRYKIVSYNKYMDAHKVKELKSWKEMFINLWENWDLQNDKKKDHNKYMESLIWKEVKIKSFYSWLYIWQWVELL